MVVILASIVNFAVVVFVLWKFGRKPATQFVAARTKSIGDAIAEAQKQSQEAEKLYTEFEVNWKGASSHAETHRQQSILGIERLRETTLSSARIQAKRVQEEAKMVGLGEVAKAKQALSREIVDKAIQMAAQFLRRSLNEEDKQRLVMEYVEALGDAKTK